MELIWIKRSIKILNKNVDEELMLTNIVMTKENEKN